MRGAISEAISEAIRAHLHPRNARQLDVAQHELEGRQARRTALCREAPRPLLRLRHNVERLFTRGADSDTIAHLSARLREGARLGLMRHDHEQRDTVR